MMKNLHALFLASLLVTLPLIHVFAQNVGIGTAAPLRKLQVDGNAGFSGTGTRYLYYENDNTMGIQALAKDQEFRIRTAVTSGTGTLFPIPLRILGKRTAIGYTLPGPAYDVTLDVNGQIRINDASATSDYVLVSSDADGTAEWQDPNTLFDDNDWTRSGSNLYPSNIGDNVGIGVNTPQTRLHVSDASGATLRLDRAGANPNAGDVLGELQATAFYSGFPVGRTAAIKMVAEANYTGADFRTQLQFFTRPAYSPSVERMRIEADGNVGIGVTDPATRLHASDDDGATLRLDRAGANPAAGDVLGEVQASAYYGGTSVGRAAAIRMVAENNFSAGSYRTQLQFFTRQQYANAAERMRIDADGNVGIGLTAPQSNLHVDGTIIGGARSSAVNGTVDENREGIRILGPDSDYIMSTQDGSGRIQHKWNATVGTGETYLSGGENAWFWDVTINGNPYMEFKYADGGGVSAGDPITWDTHMAFKSDGNVGIGLTNPTYKLHVNGRLKTNGINETSDQRLKRNIETIDASLASVQQLRGVTYEWRQDEFPEMNFAGGKQYGVVAQEVERVLPDLVETDSEGYKSVQYTQLVGVLIEAIKTQQTQIEALQLELDQTKADASKADIKLKASLNAQKEAYQSLLKRVEKLEMNSEYTSKSSRH